MTALPSFPGFRPQASAFLRRLARNNRKEWFEAHRDEYERELRDPLLLLIEEMDVRFATLAPEIVGDPKRSPFRIYRDVRFSADKRPFKTTVACWFFHRGAGRTPGERAHSESAGFYFHVAERGGVIAAGYPAPPPPTLAKIRDAIAERHEELEAIVRAPAFKRRFGALEEERMLARTPRGFAPDHPAARWLRFQSFVAVRDLTEKELADRRLPDRLIKDCAVLLPLVRWLNAAIGSLPRTTR
jgi:uncharacterized protein (TIGR02453 family)